MKSAARRATPVLFLIACALTACARSTASPPDAAASSSAPTSEASTQPSRSAGQRVVVEVGDATFWEATVTGVEPGAVQIRVGIETHAAPPERIHDIGSVATTPLPGAFAACRIGTGSWVACRIEKASAESVTATDQWGSPHELALSELIQLDDDAQARVGARMGGMERARAFARDASSARLPARPPGWKPLPGKLVIAWYGDGLWREARITGVTPNEVDLVWLERGTRAKRPSERIAPTTGERRAPRVGEFALARRADAVGWEANRVLRVDDREVELEDRAGVRERVPTAAVIALDR